MPRTLQSYLSVRSQISDIYCFTSLARTSGSESGVRYANQASLHTFAYISHNVRLFLSAARGAAESLVCSVARLKSRILAPDAKVVSLLEGAFDWHRGWLRGYPKHCDATLGSIKGLHGPVCRDFHGRAWPLGKDKVVVHSGRLPSLGSRVLRRRRVEEIGFIPCSPL